MYDDQELPRAERRPQEPPLDLLIVVWLVALAGVVGVATWHVIERLW